MTSFPGLAAPIPLGIPHTQNTAPVLEFRCLFTGDLRRKQKRWQDGKLKFHTHNKRVMVYDERSNYVGDMHWREEFPLGEGEELELERGGIRVEVGECVGKTDQDLTELVDKRVKDREGRAAAMAAKGTPTRAPAASIQGDGTSSLQPPSKSLHALLGPSGHYGRALVTGNSPFDDRQRTAAGNTDGKENERPAKRQRMNDTPSKNGYAQNLMGATLNLTSSRPPSTAPIRYEPMRVKVFSNSETVDLTLDDDSGEATKENQKSTGRQDEGAGRQRTKTQRRYDKSPPSRSTYAGSLTGVTLNLSMSLSRRDAHPPKQKPQRPDRLNEVDGSTLEDENARPPTRVQAVSKPMAKKLKQDLSPFTNSEDDRRSGKNKSNTAVKDLKAHKREALSLASSDQSSEDDIQPLKKATTVSRSTTKGPKPPKRDQLPLLSSDEDIQPSKKARITKGTANQSRPAKRDVVSILSSSSPTSPERTAPSPKIHRVNPTTAVQSSLANEARSKPPVASLRIKSRPPRKMMMMLMDPSSRARTLSDSSVKSQAVVGKTSSYLKGKPNEIVLSQDTTQLNAFCQKQEAKLQARLSRKQQSHLKPESSSSPRSAPSPSGSGIDYPTIDMLLSRKSIQIIRNEPGSEAIPKSTGRKEMTASSAIGIRIGTGIADTTYHEQHKPGTMNPAASAMVATSDSSDSESPPLLGGGTNTSISRRGPDSEGLSRRRGDKSPPRVLESLDLHDIGTISSQQHSAPPLPHPLPDALAKACSPPIAQTQTQAHSRAQALLATSEKSKTDMKKDKAAAARDRDIVNIPKPSTLSEIPSSLAIRNPNPVGGETFPSLLQVSDITGGIQDGTTLSSSSPSSSSIAVQLRQEEITGQSRREEEEEEDEHMTRNENTTINVEMEKPLPRTKQEDATVDVVVVAESSGKKPKRWSEGVGGVVVTDEQAREILLLQKKQQQQQQEQVVGFEIQPARRGYNTTYTPTTTTTTDLGAPSPSSSPSECTPPPPEEEILRSETSPRLVAPTAAAAAVTFIPPHLSGAIQSATDHFLSLLNKSPDTITGTGTDTGTGTGTGTVTRTGKVSQDLEVVNSQIRTAVGHDATAAARLEQPTTTARKTMVKPSPHSSPLLPEDDGDDSYHSRPASGEGVGAGAGQCTLEQAESTQVIEMVDIPNIPAVAASPTTNPLPLPPFPLSPNPRHQAATAALIPPQPEHGKEGRRRGRVANPATTRGRSNKSLQELAASTANANDILLLSPSPFVFLGGSASSAWRLAGPSPQQPQPQPQPHQLPEQVQVQVSMQTRGGGQIAENLSSRPVTTPLDSLNPKGNGGGRMGGRIYPAPPSRRETIASAAASGAGIGVGVGVGIGNQGGDQAANRTVPVLVLGGVVVAANSSGEGGDQKRESGLGAQDGPWSREAFDLFGEWIRPIMDGGGEGEKLSGGAVGVVAVVGVA